MSNSLQVGREAMAISLEFEAGGWKFLFEAQEESYPT
jgi:hypothetical protein